ncbi:MAG: glycosyltransferase family 39 protein [Acidobacteriia bacterium]|nr:glycosyltransferase family 39 protein [Terriglobia bacterium]
MSRLLERGALLTYCLLAALLILQHPGLQYDEALLVLGSVHMQHSSGELTLPHDPGTWICPLDRCLPLMTVRYVGAIKEYLCLPLFAMFDPHTAVLRFLSALLGLICLWGIARLVRTHVGEAAAALTCAVLAVHPAYLDLTVFDNGAVAIWMGALGVLALAASSYLSRKDLPAAFWFGAAMGLGVWARANFLWLLIAMAASAAIVLGKQVIPPMRQLSTIFAGGIAGGLPLLVYQVVSRGGTFEAMGMFSSQEPLAGRIPARLRMLSEVLLSDGEHRAIWAGPPLPDWQPWFMAGIVLAACVVCLWKGTRWARFAALQFLILAAILVSTRMSVSQHHLVVLVPLAAFLTVLALLRLCDVPGPQRAVPALDAPGQQPASTPERAPFRGLLPRRIFRWFAAALGLVYLCIALYWQAAAVQGIAATGGVGQWSDGIDHLSALLRNKYPEREVKILDWGLQNNLFVLSNAKLRTREIYGNATTRRSERGRSWEQEVEEGGVFLFNGPENRNFPDATQGFLAAMERMRPVVHRHAVRQGNGSVYAEVVEIEPGTPAAPQPPRVFTGKATSRIRMADPAAEAQLEGFHAPEQGSWRWTGCGFSVSLAPPEPSAGARLVLDLTVPEPSLRQLGPITLSARLGDRDLGSQTYPTAGNYTFVRRLDGAWLHKDANTIAFQLNRCLPPSERDGRELGLVIRGVALEKE